MKLIFYTLILVILNTSVIYAENPSQKALQKHFYTFKHQDISGNTIKLSGYFVSRVFTFFQCYRMVTPVHHGRFTDW